MNFAVVTFWLGIACVVIAIILVIVYLGITRKPNETNWVCINDVNAPIRRNATGDIECMSKNGQECAWKSDQTGCIELLKLPVDPLIPLVCKESQYRDSNHWCALGKRYVSL